MALLEKLVQQNSDLQINLLRSEVTQSAQMILGLTSDARKAEIACSGTISCFFDTRLRDLPDLESVAIQVITHLASAGDEATAAVVKHGAGDVLVGALASNATTSCNAIAAITHELVCTSMYTVQ